MMYPSRMKEKLALPQLERLEDRTVPAVPYLRNFPGVDFQQDLSQAVPPDTTMGVGPNHVVEAVNSSVAIFNKAGRRLSLQAMDPFFGGAANGTFDPVVTYDDIHQRFIVSAIQMTTNPNTAVLFVAVSNTSDPTLGFTEKDAINIRQQIGGGDFWGDYPKMGYNADGVYFTFNMFSFGGGFDHVQVVSITAASLLDRTPGVVSFSSNRPAGEFTLAGASMHGAAPGGPEYFAASTFPSGNSIEVIRATNLLSNNPTFAVFNVMVNAYAAPPGVVQPAPGAVFTRYDDRMLNAEWRNNRLVCAHSIGVGTVSNARWYEFNTAPAIPRLLQQGNINPGANIFTFFPAISISTDGGLGLTYMQSSATQPWSMYVTARRPTDPAGTMEAPILVKLGAMAYSQPGFPAGTPLRGGDYAGIGVDPIDGTYWAANEYATNTTAGGANWGTWVAQFGFSTLVNRVLPPFKLFFPLRYLFDANTGLYSGFLTLTNVGAFANSGPLLLIFPALPPGVTLVNRTGLTRTGLPFFRVSQAIGAHQTIRLFIALANPLQVPLGTFFLGLPVTIVLE
jgi:hypothetical protein